MSNDIFTDMGILLSKISKYLNRASYEDLIRTLIFTILLIGFDYSPYKGDDFIKLKLYTYYKFLIYIQELSEKYNFPLPDEFFDVFEKLREELRKFTRVYKSSS